MGPLIGGALLEMRWDPAHLFMLGCVPALVSAGAAWALHARRVADNAVTALEQGSA
jgi:AAHS family 4-hydroxybenzoate transporter-like MFS transporter